MRLTPGSRLRSQVCTTEVIVVRGDDLTSDLTCGGVPMVPASGPATTTGTPLPGFDGGNLIGKRYGHGSLEVLVTKQGVGSIAVGTTLLEPQQARSLPSSD
jgi:hypothetical protein